MTALNMGNAGSNTDGVRLVDDNAAIIDTVIYGDVNTDGHADDCADPAVSFVLGGFSSEVIARSPNATDTNLSGADFVRTQKLHTRRAEPLSENLV